MKNIETRNSALLLFASLIWGISFVFQSLGGQQLGSYTFNGLRMYIGALVVFILIKIFDKKGLSKKPADAKERKSLIITGIVCGLFLSIATNLQQVPLTMGVNTGKAGFLTALYILLVPIIGLFFKQKCGWNIWVGLAIALVGLYFLCINGEFSFTFTDILLLLCALGFACQIITIDRYGASLDSLRLSAIEFLVAGITTTPLAIIFEIAPYKGGFGVWLGNFTNGSLWISLLYMGVLSCGVAYSLQIIGQKGLNPTLASLLMSFEAVFSTLAGWVILKQNLSGREIFGCVLMFIAICVAQINFSAFKKKTT